MLFSDPHRAFFNQPKKWQNVDPHTTHFLQFPTKATMLGDCILAWTTFRHRSCFSQLFSFFRTDQKLKVSKNFRHFFAFLQQKLYVKEEIVEN